MDYINWESVKEEDTNWYVACLKSEVSYQASALIDSGELLKTMRKYMEYRFLRKDILEFGCGNGRMTKYLRGCFGKYYAVDISEVMLKQAKEKVGAEFIKSNGKNIPAEPVDIIFTFTVLMHNKKAKVPAIVKEFHRLLKPGGYLFMQLPCYTERQDRDKFDDVSIWTPEEIQELGEGFEILHIADCKRPLGSQIAPEHFDYHVFRRVV